MFLGALGASLFGNLITDKGVKQAKTLDCVDKASNQHELTYLDKE